MNVNQLRYFNAVIAKGSYADAARTLYISPQAISKSIKALEDELGAPLFRREGRSVIPTDLARGLAQQTTDAVQLFEDLFAYASGYQDDHAEPTSIRLGVVTTPYRCHVFSSNDFDLYRLQHPRCKLDVQFLTNEHCASALKAGLIDAALIHGSIEKEGYHHHRVGSLHPFAAMRADHELAGKESLTLNDLDERLVALPLDVQCALSLLVLKMQARRARPRFVEIAPTLEATSRFLKDGGIVLMAKEHQMDRKPSHIAAVPFDPAERFTIPLNLVYGSKQLAGIPQLYAYVVNLTRRRMRKSA